MVEFPLLASLQAGNVANLFSSGLNLQRLHGNPSPVSTLLLTGPFINRYPNHGYLQSEQLLSPQRDCRFQVHRSKGSL